LCIFAGTDLGFKTGKEIDIGKNAMELILLTQIGELSNIEALRAATGNFTKLGHRAGSIVPGFPADLISFAGNPADDIREVLKVHHVFKGGKEVIMN
jgi:imidazolonepropionase-like amidohydrolase